jgi:hypothetical protein
LNFLYLKKFKDGSLCLFDEAQNLTSLCFSWLNEYVNGIYQTLRKKAGHAQLSDGKEVAKITLLS